MNKIVLSAATLILLQVANAVADTAATAGGPYFQSGERQLDLYGTSTDKGHLGIGVGANYFFNSWWGAGLETRVEKFDWPNQISANLFARYPVEKWRLAPYAYGGCGRQFHDTSQWLFHIGGGVDYRLNGTTGLFVDVRETFPETSKDYTLWRFGVRLRF